MREDGVCQHFLVAGPGHGLQWPLGLSFSFVPSHHGRKTTGTACPVSHLYFPGPWRRLVPQNMEWSRAQCCCVLRAAIPFPAVGTRGLHLFAPSVSSQPLAMPRRLGWSKKSKTAARSIREQAQNHPLRSGSLAEGRTLKQQAGGLGS